MESNNLDKEQKELITAMEKAVKRSSGIVSELQRFTRPLQPVYTSFHFDEELHRLLALYSSQIERQQIDITFDCPAPITFQGDRDLINELLENLLKNALEAQPGGGWVRINLSEDETSVHLKMENGGFLVDVGDARRIGEPYFTTKTRGTGLGLALSNRIAKAHAGKITFFPDHDKHQLTILLTLTKKSAE
jgi:signal transduction histidine kinase